MSVARDKSVGETAAKDIYIYIYTVYIFQLLTMEGIKSTWSAT